MIEHLERPEQMWDFDRLGYRFCAGESDENTYTFIKDIEAWLEKRRIT